MKEAADKKIQIILFVNLIILFSVLSLLVDNQLTNQSLTEQDSLIVTLKTELKEAHKQAQKYKQAAEVLGTALYKVSELKEVTNVTRKQIEQLLNQTGFDVVIDTIPKKPNNNKKEK